MASKKPVVAWGIVVVAAVACLANALTGLAVVTAVGQRPAQEVVVTAILSIVVVGASAFILLGTLRATFRSRWPVWRIRTATRTVNNNSLLTMLGETHAILLRHALPWPHPGHAQRVIAIGQTRYIQVRRKERFLIGG